MEYGQNVQQELSHNHNVARHCRKRDIGEDGTPMDGAFLLRADEPYLSTNWLEHFHPSDRHLQLNGVLQSLRGKRNVANNAFLSVLNVGIAVSACQKQLKLELRFVLLRESCDPSHTGIYGYAGHNAKTAAVLAKSVNLDEVYPVGDIS